MLGEVYMETLCTILQLFSNPNTVQKLYKVK